MIYYFISLLIFQYSTWNFKKDFIYIFLERGEGKEKRGGVKRQCVVASCIPLCNPGMYPDWESNRPHFRLQDAAQSTELHQPGHTQNFLMRNQYIF